jgi:hypothetical protein
MGKIGPASPARIVAQIASRESAQSTPTAKDAPRVGSCRTAPQLVTGCAGSGKSYRRSFRFDVRLERPVVPRQTFHASTVKSGANAKFA